jgi:hypothetical protein
MVMVSASTEPDVRVTVKHSEPDRAKAARQITQELRALEPPKPKSKHPGNVTYERSRLLHDSDSPLKMSVLWGKSSGGNRRMCTLKSMA